MPSKSKEKPSNLSIFDIGSPRIEEFSSLEDTRKKALACTACDLCKTRNNVVFFDGNPKAKLMIIGEGPGQKEDETGIPFVGRAGQLLDKILASVEIDRQKETYICNIVKCRPPANRVPTPQEMAMCSRFLEAQIAFVKPKLIMLAGATAVKALLKVKDPISRIRGKWIEWPNGVKVMPVFHPSYLLRNDTKQVGSPKWLMWQDIKEVRKQLDLLNSNGVAK